VSDGAGGGSTAGLDAAAAAIQGSGGSSGPTTPGVDGLDVPPSTQTDTAAAEQPGPGLQGPEVSAAVGAATPPDAAVAVGSTGGAVASPVPQSMPTSAGHAVDAHQPALMPPLHVPAAPASDSPALPVPVDVSGAPLPRELPAAHQQILALQEQVARLRQHLADAAAAGEDSGDEEEGSSDEESGSGHTRCEGGRGRGGVVASSKAVLHTIACSVCGCVCAYLTCCDSSCRMPKAAFRSLSFCTDNALYVWSLGDLSTPTHPPAAARRQSSATSTSPRAHASQPRPVAPSPAEQAAEERRRNAHRGTIGTLWLGG
jgi:hypothetical protein